MGRFKVLDGRGEEIGYGENQTTRISSLIFLSFAEILAMITSYRNKAIKRICWFVKRFKMTNINIADYRLDKSYDSVNLNLLNFYEVRLKIFWSL